MDISHLVDLKIAPRHVFDALEERRTRVRFMVPTSKGVSPVPAQTRGPNHDWRAVTWGAFADEIREVALFLSTVTKSGERSAIYAPNRVEWASASLAIQAAGGVMVPVYPASTAEQLAYVASHSDARVLFVDTAALLGRVFEAWPSLGAVERIVLLDDAIDAAQAHEAVRARIANVTPFEEIARKLITLADARAIGAAMHREDPRAFERTMNAVSLDQPGVMLYTSGTSGNPKGVPLTHRNVGVNGLDWMKTLAPLLEEGAVDILWLPMSHIFGFGEMCIGNSLGWTSYLSDPASCLTELPEVKPSVFFSVPSHWEKLASQAMHEPTPDARLVKFRALTGGRLHFCLSGGAGLKREVKDFFYACGLLLVEGYGLTETSPTLTMNRPDAFRFDSVGKAFPSVELKLAEDGEILARGANVFSGYHKDPDATREAFTDDGWFKTGDIGRFTDDGFLQIVDRKKDILVTAGGKNVPPANIELRFRDDPLISHVVVYGDAKKFLVAGVWLNDEVAQALIAGVAAEGRDAAKRALVQKRIDQINAQLASYETIKKFAVMDAPLTVEAELLTPSLKIRRKKIYDRFRAQFEALYTVDGPAVPRPSPSATNLNGAARA
jgi:long-chain acyl-CoA synthetase